MALEHRSYEVGRQELVANIAKVVQEFCLGLFLIVLQLERQAPVSIEAGHLLRIGTTAVELRNLRLGS